MSDRNHMPPRPSQRPSAPYTDRTRSAAGAGRPVQRGVNQTSGQRGARPAAPVRQARPGAGAQRPYSGSQRPGTAAHRPPVRRRRGNHPIAKVLKGIGYVLYMLFWLISRPFVLVNRCLNVFRRGEASTIIVNSALGVLVISAAICVFLAIKPGMDASRARSYAEAGNVEEAMRLVRALEKDEYPAGETQAIRVIAAEKLIDAGKFEAAKAAIGELNEGENKRQLDLRNTYAEADSLYASGRYGEAAQIFYQIDSYQDSASRYADCRCALAIEAWQKGDEGSARSLLLDVPDVVQHVSNAAIKVAGSAEGAQQILSAELFRAENLTEMSRIMQELHAARSDMPKGRIAAGSYHTVGLKSDGTLLAVGDNRWGQLEVYGWSGVAQVAAGAQHTVALLNDGTVRATGGNSEGQCNVSGWTDIIAIAAGSYDTIGLKRDGTVVACGKNSSLTAGWHDVTSVAGGSYSLACLYDQGAMRSTHSGAQLAMGLTLYDLSICGPVSVGVLYDGSMVSSFDGAPQWTDMVSVIACETGILGIDVDGRVRTHFYRPGDAAPISVSDEAVELASSGTHHVVLTSDGRVQAFGSNEFGQCNVADWQL